MKDLVEEFIKLKLGYADKEFAVSNDVGILYEAIKGSDDDEDEDNLPKKLGELGWSNCDFFPLNFGLIMIQELSKTVS